MVTGHADDFSGYLTTPEEYERQGYEGAFTQFGRWTLPGWQTRLRRLAARMVAPSVQLGQAPAVPQDLDARLYPSCAAQMARTHQAAPRFSNSTRPCRARIGVM